ncbi:monoglyceride lipase [Nephila pilipes]|uniref:Monoglyceride lipase n=1 Tax=Nephila pilipes TaxID=299642 RepID=A0A8X6UP31_NEPPI|nr:monoglyceride lipase [Nephila pilipes]
MAPLSSNLSHVHSYSTSILNTKGQKLFCKYWEPPEKARALVFIAHGYAEHCLLYDPLAQTLASNNFYVFSHDHVGHGQSEGIRAQIDTFDKFVDDVFNHIDLVRNKFPDLICFICGHSMGGAISILAALKKPDFFNGVILIGPAVTTNPEVTTPFKTALAKIDCSTSSCSFDLSLRRPGKGEKWKKIRGFHGFAKQSLVMPASYLTDLTSSVIGHDHFVTYVAEFAQLLEYSRVAK